MKGLHKESDKCRKITVVGKHYNESKKFKKKLKLKIFYLGLKNWLVEGLCCRQNRPVPSSKCSVPHACSCCVHKRM